MQIIERTETAFCEMCGKPFMGGERRYILVFDDWYTLCPECRKHLLWLADMNPFEAQYKIADMRWAKRWKEILATERAQMHASMMRLYIGGKATEKGEKNTCRSSHATGAQSAARRSHTRRRS